MILGGLVRPEKHAKRRREEREEENREKHAFGLPEEHQSAVFNELEVLDAARAKLDGGLEAGLGRAHPVDNTEDVPVDVDYQSVSIYWLIYRG